MRIVTKHQDQRLPPVAHAVKKKVAGIQVRIETPWHQRLTKMSTYRASIACHRLAIYQVAMSGL
jgi:hypothetical protein